MRKRIIFRKTNLLENVSKKRLFFGILAGLLFSFAFYNFLFGLREALRIISSLIESPSHLFILETKEVSFYNFVFAVFSSILGLSITLKIILEKPKRFNASYFGKKHSMFIDISVINSYFLSGIFKFIFIVTFSYSNAVENHHFSFYSEYRYLVYLILIVMFLELWKTIRLVFKNKALKWMAISLVSILAYSFTLSKIDIIHYKRINNSILVHQLDYKYEYDPPEVDNYKKIVKRSLLKELFIVYPKEEINHNNFPTIIYKKDVCAIEDISILIKNIRDDYHENQLPWVTFRLNIDKNIKMRHVSLIKQKIAEHNFSRIAYGILRKDLSLSKEVQPDIVVFERLRQIVATPSQPVPPKAIYKKEDLYTIILGENENILNTIEIENVLRRTPSKIMHLKSTETANLNDYLQAKDALLSIYHKLRNEYAMETHGKTFHQLNRDQTRDIKRNIYPMIIWLDESY